MACRRHFGRSALLISLGLGVFATCLSVLIHRDVTYASEATFGGGWPLVFLVDQPGVSVTGRLTLLEDVIYPTAFVLDALFWATAFWFVGAGSRRLRRLRSNR
jgi:hypothetical protein